MKPEELTAVLAANNDSMTTALTAALKPVVDSLGAIAASQTAITEKLEANSQEAAKAAEKEMRDAVAKVHGTVIANNLAGDNLKQVYDALGTPADGITTNSGLPNDASGYGAALPEKLTIS